MLGDPMLASTLQGLLNTCAVVSNFHRYNSQERSAFCDDTDHRHSVGFGGIRLSSFPLSARRLPFERAVNFAALVTNLFLSMTRRSERLSYCREFGA